MKRQVAWLIQAGFFRAQTHISPSCPNMRNGLQKTSSDQTNKDKQTFRLDYVADKWDFLNVPWGGSLAKDNFGHTTLVY